MSAAPITPGLSTERFSIFKRFLRGLFLSVFINPFALVVAVIAIFAVTHLVGGLYAPRPTNDPAALGSIWRCGACIAALLIVAVMATSHFVVTVLLGVYRRD